MPHRERANVRSRSHARSGDAAFATLGGGGGGRGSGGPLVIAAQPRRDDKAAPYSVYGTPGINYSEFYRNPPPPKKEKKPASTKSGR